MKTDLEILERLGQDRDIRAILEIIRNLQLEDSWLAAGSVRNFIWNILSGKSGFDAETDVDVISLIQLCLMRKLCSWRWS